MAGLNIPGVTDQYNTNDTVEKLMKIERIPLTREQNQLESLKTEKNAWRDINTKLSSLRDNTKTLYSFENPFNSKLTSSTEEYAITAEANRSASLQSFKVDVIQAASSDRFLTDELENDFKVPVGTYTYKVGEKQITFNWKGGTLKDFSNAINKRGNNIIKSSIIGASAGNKSLLIEAVPTGKENRLIFEDDAKTFAFDSGMVDKIKSQTQTFASSQTEILPVNKIEYDEPVYMPPLSLTNTKYDEEKQTATVEPRGAYQVKVPEKILRDTDLHLQFTITQKETEDITPEINKTLIQPELPDAGTAEYGGIIISNNLSDTNLNLPPEPPAPLEPVKTNSILYAVMEDGSEKEIPYTPAEDGKAAQIDVKLLEYPGLKAIAIRNLNTGTSYEISSFTALDPVKDLGYGPKHPVSTADDAIIKYEGITITRSSNKIDDVVPEITLNIHDKTEKTATIAVKPDTEASKAAIIEFVGKYNQAVAELNILSQNKQEIIDELDYLSPDEKEAEQKKLGLFQSDFSLTNIKSNMSSTLAARYLFSDTAEITMLSQLGIATNAGGYSGGYSQSKLRGYLEIDEKKLDDAISNHLDDIKMLFGYDSDGDLIVDTGIAYKLDKQISAYTQTGGILAMKTSSLDSKIKSSESKISKLENQMAKKEAELRNKYSQMEGSLNSLEAQQNTISNFTKQQQNQK
ncbi:MAG: flagellar filament capping protein FliD [Treponema sp.]|nr:flagellar filament capping protein FliD [Spirochaetia bacterium]MDD7533383.1 flagellar filament capping protein FliD [Treponema sp.]MDY5757764.1 flagellar filament capping protein FliD [Treponema sp.]